MHQENWTAVDRFITDLLVPTDEGLENALHASSDAGLPQINVAPNQGKLLQLLALLRGARTILEIGTLGGYSTIWLARALPPGGKLVTLEFEPKHAQVARKNISQASLADVVEVIEGPAQTSLKKLIAENHAPFDFIFIDADKESYPQYFELALRLSAVGTCIVADNVIRQGAIVEPAHHDPRVQGARRLLERMSLEPRVSATALQTVGCKGYDGLALALVIS